MQADNNQKDPRNFAVFILGAGFSRPAGLPLADELWREVFRRATGMEGRAEQFMRDLDYYIKFTNECDGVEKTRETVDFEKFLGFLDIEFHLGLRGPDTWSREGNESQIVVKTLIGEILTERMPSKIPKLYLDFARKLQPGDTVLTFNYDLLVERALDQVGKPYRLFPDRYKSVGEDGSAVGDSERDLQEVLVLKLHGSLDWFDKKSYLRREEYFRRAGTKGHPSDPIFNPSSGLGVLPLLDGPRHPDDPLREVYRVLQVNRLYTKQILFLATPILIPPSFAKVLWFERFKDFWWGMDRQGALNLSMALVGFSLAHHDDYARQVIYTIIKNYQHKDEGLRERRKAPLLIVDLQDSADRQDEYRKKYSFVDWTKTTAFFEGFNEAIVEKM